MLYSILTNTEGSQPAAANDQWMSWVLIGVVIVLVIVMLVVSSRRNKKRQQEAEKLINSVRPGNKVKTIGGVCGIVVEVDDEENTFVLETGSEASGKCYMKFDKQAIYQTDAKPEPKPETEEEAPAADSAEEPFAEEAKAEEPAQEQEAAEKTEEPEEKEEK